jgi:hypothetical protein
MVMDNQRTIKVRQTVNRAMKRLTMTGAKYTYQVGNTQATYNVSLKGMFALGLLEGLQFIVIHTQPSPLWSRQLPEHCCQGCAKDHVDEMDCHAELDFAVLRFEMKTERGRRRASVAGVAIDVALDEVVQQEMIEHLSSEGRSPLV